MQEFAEVIVKISSWFWSYPMLPLLAFTSIFVSVRIGFIHFRKFGYIMRSTLGKSFVKKSERGEGTLSPFQALTSALACCVGAGNIVGVPIAIIWGGPGAVFWMWMIALLAMGLKYGEIILAIKYRQTNEKGEYVGGPTYYMTKGMNNRALAVMFALALMVTVIISSMTQANSLAISAEASMSIPRPVTGVIVMIATGLVVIGGIKRLGQITEKLVPFMATLYVGASIIVVFANISAVPEMLGMIFKYAFTPMAAVGGFGGSVVAKSIRWGVARGAYSNEAGSGTSPIAHAAATTDHPVRQAMWGVVEVFLDTIVICTCTAFVVLSTGVWKIEGAADFGGGLSTIAFQSFFGTAGGYLTTISLIMFVYSTLIVLIWYGEKQAEFLFGSKAAIIYRFLCVLMIPVGAIGAARYLWQFLDLAGVFLRFPNIIAILYLSKDIAASTKEFFCTPGKYYLKEEVEDKVA